MIFSLAYQHYKKSAEVDNNVIKSDDRVGEIITNTAEGILCIKWDNAEYETFIKRHDGNYWYIGTDEYHGEKLLVVALGGGLGNQLFQYAYAYFISKLDCYKGCKISYETNWYGPVNCNRNLLINYFNIDNAIPKSNVLDCIICRYATYENTLDGQLPNIYNRRICGYWQKWKYIKPYIKDLRKIFTFDINGEYPEIPDYEKMKTFSNGILEKINNSEISISVHIRRGDYLNLQNIYCINDENYYYRVMDKMCSFFDKNKITFFIFSDDIEWCKEKFSKYNAVYVDGNNTEHGSLYDLCLMSKCKHNIMANSSFSWWAAMLNDNPEKYVIAPKNWYVKHNPEIQFGCDGKVFIEE